MSGLTRKYVKKVLERMRDKRVVVIGDFMLDRYIWGEVSRISPEAPVVVVEANEDAQRPGGAGNVVLNLTSLGASCDAIGLIGDDENGRNLVQLLEQHGANTEGMIVANDRPTTVKTRVIAGNQQLLRVDREKKGEAAVNVQGQLVERVRGAIESADAVILQDYNKGLLTASLIRETIAVASEYDVPVMVDPKSNHFFEYQHATLFKPNLREAENALGVELHKTAEVEQACRELKDRLQAEAVLITRGSQGMMLLDGDNNPVHVEPKPRRISDVSGAGDTVISTITLAMISGLDGAKAVRLATHAAEYVVGRVGVVPITPEDLLNQVEG
ncbi:MAG TPA: D-glycero-beta-D-manno-heptose-7-phosphate kinase [Bacteroidetes bacterium]|nr:bifunctional protein HldE [bacterium BMS3Bbin04]HDO66005.1 D-glycero-beta-D-manno-heptose-7-phosphate kinase [Bacteroidota bacterium]HEX05130.1 D-glycero-beta-D-manno-heptose-7-phosphate kinase [Bacteroidota bacterium]